MVRRSAFTKPYHNLTAMVAADKRDRDCRCQLCVRGRCFVYGEHVLENTVLFPGIADSYKSSVR